MAEHPIDITCILRLPTGGARKSFGWRAFSFDYMSLTWFASPTIAECATVLTSGKVRCSPSSPCSRGRARCAWLRVAPLLPSPSLRAAALAAPGRDGKAGSPIELESWFRSTAASGFRSSAGAEPRPEIKQLRHRRFVPAAPFFRLTKCALKPAFRARGFFGSVLQFNLQPGDFVPQSQLNGRGAAG